MRRLVLNPATGRLDYIELSPFRGVLAAAPSSPEDGWMYINSGDNSLYLYYGGTWNLLHALAAPIGGSYYELEDGSGYYELEDGSGNYELE